MVRSTHNEIHNYLERSHGTDYKIIDFIWHVHSDVLHILRQINSQIIDFSNGTPYKINEFV